MKSAYCQDVTGSGNGVTVSGVRVECALVAQRHGCDDCIVLLFYVKGNQFAFNIAFIAFGIDFCPCEVRQFLPVFQLCRGLGISYLLTGKKSPKAQDA